MRAARPGATRAIALSAALLAALHAGPVRAQAVTAPATEESKAKARALATQAFQSLDRSEFSNALFSFNLAIANYDAPTLRVGRGAALEGLGRLGEAADDYRAAAASVPAAGEPPAFVTARAQAREKLKAVEARLDPPASAAPSQAAAGPSVDAAPAVAGAPAGAAANAKPPPAELPFTPPAPLAPPSAVLGPVESPATAEKPSYAAATALGTISLALLVGTVVTGALFLTTQEEFDEANGIPYDDAHSLRSKAQTLAWVNTGLLVGTLVGGFCTILVWPDSAPAPAQGSGAARPAPLSGLHMGVGGTF